MKRWRRTEIRVERREISLYRSERGPECGVENRCTVCGEPAALVRVEDAAAAFGVEIDVVQGWLKSGRVHGHADGNGRLMICAGSFRRET